MSLLIDDLPNALEREAAKLLDGPTDAFIVKLKGIYKEVLVCTNRRVAILKMGIMTGNTFGPNIMQLSYRQITSVDVHTGWNPYLEISTGGVNAFTQRSVTGSDSPSKAKNCITLPGRGASRFRDAANIILDRIHPPERSGIKPSIATTVSTADELRKLADLFKDGILNADEFAAQKAAILGSAPSVVVVPTVKEEHVPSNVATDDESELDSEMMIRADEAIARALRGPMGGSELRRAIFGKRV